MTDRFTDHRGVIEDLLTGTQIGAVTRIYTRKGAVRGNHEHQRTVQWTYVVSGRLRTAHQPPGDPDVHYQEIGPGDLLVEPAAVPHAWEALEDTTVLVLTQGPRSGQDYESDTRRLSVPLIAPPAS